IVSSPNGISRSIPRSTGVLFPPVTNSLVSWRHSTAAFSPCMVFITLTSKNHCRLERQRLAHAEQTGQSHNHDHRASSPGGYLPQQGETAQIQVVLRDFKKRGGHSNAERKSDRTDEQRLLQDHCDNPAVGDSDRL